MAARAAAWASYRRARWWTAGLLALLAIAAAATSVALHQGAGNLPLARAGEGTHRHPETQAVAPGAPDIVLVLTDDQRVWSLSRMEQVQSLLVERGTTFSRAMVPTSLCCPSRATLLTGRYAHHTGVWSNSRPTGSWWAFHENGNEPRTVAAELHAHGYHTGLVGKYFNSFGNWAPQGYTPPGWDAFTVFATQERSGDYFDYRLNDGTEHGSAARDYSTDVFAERAVDFIRSTPTGKPLFLMFAPYAPHAPFRPAPRHADAWKGRLPRFRSPALHEDVSDKPRWVQELRPVSRWKTRHVQRKQQEALIAVDEAVADIVAALEDGDRLSNTLIVFMSDNGLSWGEHNVLFKSVPYAPATEIPLVVRWDGHVAAGAADARLALNVDIPGTLAGAAGVPMQTEGIDLLSDARRRGFVLEAPPEQRLGRPAYCGWRTASWSFTHYATGEEELYDEAGDPDELSNLAADQQYRTRLSAMRRLARIHCSPMPPQFSWN